MRFSIHSGQSLISNQDEDLLKEKIDRLVIKYDWIVGADIFFKEENNKSHKDRICEIKLSVPGPIVFAHAKAKEFDAAILETISDLEILLGKRKDGMKWKRMSIDL